MPGGKLFDMLVSKAKVRRNDVSTPPFTPKRSPGAPKYWRVEHLASYTLPPSANSSDNTARAPPYSPRSRFEAHRADRSPPLGRRADGEWRLARPRQGLGIGQGEGEILENRIRCWQDWQ